MNFSNTGLEHYVPPDPNSIGNCPKILGLGTVDVIQIQLTGGLIIIESEGVFRTNIRQTNALAVSPLIWRIKSEDILTSSGNSRRIKNQPTARIQFGCIPEIIGPPLPVKVL